MPAKPGRRPNRTNHTVRHVAPAPMRAYAYQPTTVRPQVTRDRNQQVKQPVDRAWTFRRILAVLLIIVTLAGGWVGWNFVKNEVQIFGWKGLAGLVRPEKLKGEDQGRVNILLAGNSRDDPNHAGAELTDSIMVLSINTRQHTGFILSIPRDLHVNIPNDGYGKINEVYQQGQQQDFAASGYASGGMGMLEQTVSQALHVPIHYYALVDYAALRQAVDAVGGVDVAIHSTDPRGLYDPSPDLNNNRRPLVDLSNGLQHLDGVQALGLARARGDHYGSYGYASGDFTRTTNQRLLILALKDKTTSLGTLANPVKLSQLFNAMGSNVRTDLTFGNVHRLYNISKEIPTGSVTSDGLTDDNLLESRTIRGAYVLVPTAGIDDYTDIQAFVAKLVQK